LLSKRRQAAHIQQSMHHHQHKLQQHNVLSFVTQDVQQQEVCTILHSIKINQLNHSYQSHDDLLIPKIATLQLHTLQ
jgi:hypothetical protein